MEGIWRQDNDNRFRTYFQSSNRNQREKRNRCLDIPFFTESNIQHSINLLGGIQ